MTRVRMIALSLFGLTLLPLVGDVFGSFVVLALIPFMVVTGIGLATADGRVRIAAGALAAGVVASTVMVTFLAGGRSAEEFMFAFGPGLPRLFTTRWPSPRRPELIGFTSMVAATAVGVSHLIGRYERRRLLALVPSVGAAVFLTVAGAASGSHVLLWCWAVLAGVSYLVITTRGASLRSPDPQAVVVAALAVAVVAVVGVVVPEGHRFDPRRSNIEEVSVFVPPLEEYTNLQNLEPPEKLFELSGDIADVERFRTVTYNTYDGSRWDVGFGLEEVGTVVRAGVDADHEYTVWPLDDRVRFLPFAGEPVEVDARIAANPERDVIALQDEDVTVDAIKIRTRVAGSEGSPASIDFAATPISGQFAKVAEEIVGDATELPEQLDRLEQTMSTEWALNPPNRSSSMQSKLLGDFVTQNRRGGAAQFVAGFVLMAQTLGADARMVGGFVRDDVVLSDGNVVIDTSDARLWAEVRTESGGWRAYNPVPAEVDRDAADENAPVPIPKEGAASPPIQQPTPVDNVTTNPPPPPPEGTAGWPVWALGGVAAVAGLVAVVLLIVLFKAVRRWYWMSVGDASKRTRGAWAETTSALIDAGLAVGDSWTDLDIVRRSTTIDGVKTDDVARVAQAARTVAFSPHPPQISATDLAAGRAAVRSVRRGIRSCRNWRGRVRLRLSVRSVWPTTKTPVLRQPGRHKTPRKRTRRPGRR